MLKVKTRVYDGATAISTYSLEKFPFHLRVADMLGLVQLGQAHENSMLEPFLQVGRDQNTLWHRRFYAAINEDFRTLYRRFVVDEVLPGLDLGLIYVQHTPTFRVHLPGNLATGSFHRDRDYGHFPESINIIVPLTSMYGTAGVWIEDPVSGATLTQIPLYVGDYLVFDGANRLHGSVPNETGWTRMSFDFRVLPQWAYKETSAKTIARGVPIRLGDYYMEI